MAALLVTNHAPPPAAQRKISKYIAGSPPLSGGRKQDGGLPHSQWESLRQFLDVIGTVHEILGYQCFTKMSGHTALNNFYSHTILGLTK